MASLKVQIMPKHDGAVPFDAHHTPRLAVGTILEEYLRSNGDHAIPLALHPELALPFSAPVGSAGVSPPRGTV
jgi:hypothetical protein